MTRKPSTHRVDGNQAPIVEVAVAFGWEALSLTSVGGGAPDLLLWHPLHGFRLAEVKNPDGRGTTLRATQTRFRERYRMPVLDLRSADEAHDAFVAIAKASRN